MLEFQKKSVVERRELALTAAEALEQAAAEGLPLLRTPGARTGFRYVFPQSKDPRGGRDEPDGHLRFVAQLWLPDKCKQLTLGSYATAEEAALNVARCMGRDAALAAKHAMDTVALSASTEQPLTKEDVLRQAAEEGLSLAVSLRKSATGYQGVVAQRNGWFGAQYADHKRRRTTWLGNFRLAEEAALCFARFQAGTLKRAARTASTTSARRAVAAVRGAELRTEKRRLAAESGVTDESPPAGQLDDEAVDEPARSTTSRGAAAQARLRWGEWLESDEEEDGAPDTPRGSRAAKTPRVDGDVCSEQPLVIEAVEVVHVVASVVEEPGDESDDAVLVDAEGDDAVLVEAVPVLL